MDLGNSGQCADVLRIFLHNCPQCLHIAREQFDIEGKSFVAFRQPLQPFINRHISIV